MKLSELFADWQRIRKEMIGAVKSLTQEQLDWKPEGGLHSIADLLRHISETELGWLGDFILNKIEYRDLTPQMAPDIDSILDGLEKSHTYVLDVLQLENIDSLGKKYKHPDTDEVLTLKDVIFHTFEHEARHRGQIFMLMRLQGIAPPNV